MSNNGHMLDNEIKQIMDFFREDRKRLFGDKQRVIDAFETMHTELIGTNNLKLLKQVAKSSFLDDSISIDIRGWEEDNLVFDKARVIVDECYALLMPIYFTVIPMLTKNDTLKDVKLMQPLSMAGQSISPQMIVEEKAGFFDRLSGIKDSLSPRWKKDYKQGFGQLNDKLQYLNRPAVLWTKYLSDHEDHISQAIDWNAAMFVYEYQEEKEALRNCRDVTMFLLATGYDILRERDNKNITTIVGNLLQAKAAAMSQNQRMDDGYGQRQPPVQLNIVNRALDDNSYGE